MKKTPGKDFTIQQQSFFEDDASMGKKTRQASPYTNLNGQGIENLLQSIIALSLLKGIGFRSVCELFDTGAIDTFWNLSEGNLKRLINGLPVTRRLDINQIMGEKAHILESANRIISELQKREITFLHMGSDRFPQSLFKLHEPPRWIFVQGNPDCLSANAIVAVVGTRNPTSLGLTLASQCAGELVKRNAIVLSGLAKGIDEQAHQGAVSYFGQSIAVLGYGILVKDTPHDTELAEKIVQFDGAIISEYLPYDIPSRTGFLRRNELQASLSNLVIPVECPSLESGTGATIRRAMKIGTPVVGITPENETNDSLQATKTNLELLQRPVFKVRSDNSKDFWDFLRKVMPEHDWTINLQPSQQRFFRDIVKNIIHARSSLSIDEKAIDRLAEELKEAIRKEK